MGNKIVTTKEFDLVFYITCFVPFVRPTVPLLKENEILKIKEIEKERLKRRRANHMNNVTNGDIKNENEGMGPYLLDMRPLDSFKAYKDNLAVNMLNEDSSREPKTSILVALYDDEFNKK